MKNPLLIKKYKAFRGDNFENIGYLIEGKSEEEARSILIQELDWLGIYKPYEMAQQFVIVEIMKDPLK